MVGPVLYTVFQKSTTKLMAVKSQTDFQSFFTVGKRRKFPIKVVYYFPPNLKYVAALALEIILNAQIEICQRLLAYTVWINHSLNWLVKFLITSGIVRECCKDGGESLWNSLKFHPLSPFQTERVDATAYGLLASNVCIFIQLSITSFSVTSLAQVLSGGVWHERFGHLLLLEVQ